jgi:ribosome biogenesis GTPase A
VAIVGEFKFKRGKSTFINALLGEKILPADVMPCSATLNRIKYGQTPAVTLLFKDHRQQAIPIQELTQYVTKLTEDAEVMAASIQEAVVYYPSAYCKNNSNSRSIRKSSIIK